MASQPSQMKWNETHCRAKTNGNGPILPLRIELSNEKPGSRKENK